MFDIGMFELFVIVVVAIIVVGPRELPGMLRTVGRMVSKARGMAREFQHQFEQAADEAGVNEIKEDLEKASDYGEFMDFDEVIDPVREAGDELKKSVDLDDNPASGTTAARAEKTTDKKVSDTKTTDKKTAGKSTAARKSAGGKPTSGKSPKSAAKAKSEKPVKTDPKPVPDTAS